MKPVFKILFFLFKSKINNKDQAPIYCRITMNGKRKHFSTGFFISLNHWNKSTHSVKSNCPHYQEINNYLIAIKSKSLALSLKHQLNNKEFTLDAFVNELLGKHSHIKTFLEVFKKHNLEIKNLVGKSYSPATLQKFEGIYKQIKDFIQFMYKQNDVLLSNLKLKFLLDLEYYLLTERNMKQISINKTIQRVKKITKYAIGHEFLEKDPFLLHKAKSVSLDVIFLDNVELSILEQYDFKTDRLNKVRDCFVSYF